MAFGQEDIKALRDLASKDLKHVNLPRESFCALVEVAAVKTEGHRISAEKLKNAVDVPEVTILRADLDAMLKSCNGKPATPAESKA